MNKIAIIYTDGSAKPNDTVNGKFGWGAHGYIYDGDIECKKTSNKPSKYLVTNKGYLETNEFNDEIHHIVDPIEYLDWYGNSDEPGTNNMGELIGYIESVKKLLTMNVKHIVCKLDSNYVISIIEYVDTYSKDMMADDGKPNLEYRNLARDVRDNLINDKVTLEIIKVKGHHTHLGNNLADKLALIGRLETVKNVPKYIEYGSRVPKGYWNPTVNRHPFLQFKRVYFMDETDRVNVEDGLYSMLNYKKDDEIGKQIHTASYALIYLKKKDDLIESLKHSYKNELRGHSMVSTLDLSVLYNPNNYNYITRYGDKVLTYSNKYRPAVTVLEEDLLINAVTPPGLAIKAMNNTSYLNEIRDEWNAFNEDNSYTSTRQYFELNDLFYTTNNKNKNILRPEITNLVKEVTYMYDDGCRKAPIIIQFGKDILDRNHLKKIESLEPKVILVVERTSKNRITYHTIINLDKTGDQCVMSSYYSNKVLLK